MSSPTQTKSKIDSIQDTLIDEDGVFKYIQIKIKSNEKEKIIIRGSKDLDYHMENLERFIEKEGKGLDKVKAIGGGRIEINKQKKTIFIYGYSKSFGLCDHSLTQDLLSKTYKEYSITWSNEGY